MPSYLQLQTELVWGEQYVPGNLTAELLEPLRAFYGMGPAAIGSPGDNQHLFGRHRSYNWDSQSRYCIDRDYGTTDDRDQGGDRNWYRAADVGIEGETLYAASHRVDELIRSGAAPGVAEWFGTFDGQNVVGWYEGHPSSSDDSHLYHLHVGFWNGYANDPETMALVFGAITGDDMATAQEIAAEVWKLVWHSPDQPNPNNAMAADVLFGTNKFAAGAYNETATAPTLRTQLSEVKAALARIEAQLAAGGGPGGLVQHTHELVVDTGPAEPV